MLKWCVMPNKIVCLYSGGLDSTVCLYLAREQGQQIIALTVDYGQLHRKEITIASSHAYELQILHYHLKFNLPWKGSALLDPNILLPTERAESEMKDIPATYVPARNTILLSLASSCAEAKGACSVVIGVNALDYSGYPDCRPEYIQSFQDMIAKGTKTGVEKHPIKIQTPLLQMSKKEIVELGLRLKVPFEKTWSCYAGKEKPCGECDSCILRAKGFSEAGVKDPLTAAESNAHGA